MNAPKSGSPPRPPSPPSPNACSSLGAEEKVQAYINHFHNLKGMQLLAFLVMAIIKIILALSALLVGFAVFGWGLVGFFLVLSEKSVTAIEFLGGIGLFLLFYGCCSVSLLSILSIFAKRVVLIWAVKILAQLYIIGTTFYLIIGSAAAMHEGRMAINDKNIYLLIFYILISTIAIIFLNNKKLFVKIIAQEKPSIPNDWRDHDETPR